MQLSKDALLLRIYTAEQDRWQGRPVYEAVVLKAREMGCAGATVLRGVLGYGHSTRLHTTKILRLSDDLPLVIEIADTEERIKALLPELESMMGSGLVTLEKIQVLHYGTAERTAERR